MERRVRRLEAASQSVLLCQLATLAAEDAGLDPALVLHEAEALLAQYAGWSPAEIALREGRDLAALEAEARDLLARLETRRPA
jgi:hypothetical protein